jgi:hypothetical protein
MAPADRKNLDLRVSDAERDAVASELGQHFQDGRLDQAEYDERLTAALTAKTRRDLDELLTDLPQASEGQQGWAASEPDQAGAPGAAPWRSAPPGLTRGRPRVLALLPLLVAAVVIGGLLTGGWQQGWPFPPFGFLWLIVPILLVRTWVRGGRRRQWR